MKILYLLIGSLGLILTIAALMLPIVPATPFLIVALYGFSRGSRRMHHFLTGLPFIKPLYETLQREQSFTRRQKIILSALTLPIAIVPLVVVENHFVHMICLIVSIISILVICCYHHPVQQP